MMFFSPSTVGAAILSSSLYLGQIASAVTLSEYEYVVIGSGPGGGPVAARLALAGHRTLLIEAGDDQGANINYTVPAYQAKSTEDPAIAWDFYVNHYQDVNRQKRDFKLTYDTPTGGLHVGNDAPAGSTVKGILYPRAGVLGGCAAHNALVTIYPDMDDFNNISTLTGDHSWDAQNMRKYFVRMENNQYALPGKPGHGYNGYFYTDTAPLTLALKDRYLTGMILGAAKALGTPLKDLASIAAGDANSNLDARDSTPAVYQVPISAGQGNRRTVREFLLEVANAKFPNGTKRYPLDIRLNCFATKVSFDTSVSPPRAKGVNFLDGAHLYRASPLSKNAAPGVPGFVSASKEVIVSGGSYNSPQLLKLSGIGPKAELQKFGIPVIKDLPGVGANLQDHYETVVQGTMAQDFPTLDGCTFQFNGKPDPCLAKWQAGSTPSQKGTYSSSGFAACAFFKSSATPDGNYDELVFGGPVNFRGYFPGYAYNATIEHNWWSWDALKSHPRNHAGTVTLKSADPLDVPLINFNYFDAGSGDYNADLQEITEAIKFARQAFADQNTSFTERLPGKSVQTDDQIKQYIKDTTWGHHCSATCKIGADGDPMAVLDSSFRVRGVTGLRVVDASVYPEIPGTFTLTSTYLVGEKAADVIIQQTGGGVLGPDNPVGATPVAP